MLTSSTLLPTRVVISTFSSGTGVPVSEDVMVIFVGTLLSSTEFPIRHKVACVAWCYVGVVLSDLVS